MRKTTPIHFNINFGREKRIITYSPETKLFRIYGFKGTLREAKIAIKRLEK